MFSRRITHRVAALLTCVYSVGVAAVILGNLDKGLELTDEGLYFYSIHNPVRLLAMPSDFATPLHAIYTLLGQSFYHLRIFGVLLLLTVSGLFAGALLTLARRHGSLTPPATIATFLALTTSGCAYYAIWLPTPNYNWMALTGILGALTALQGYAIALRPTSDRSSRRALLRSGSLCLLGMAGTWAFIGKGTVGAGLAVLAILWMITAGGGRTGRQRLADALLAGGVALVLLTLYFALLSEGPMVTLRKILLCARNFDSTYGLPQLVSNYGQFFLPAAYIPILLLWPFCAGTAVALALRHWRAAVAATISISLYILGISWALPTSKVVGMCVPPLYALAMFMAWRFRRSTRHFRIWGRMSLFLMIMAFVFHSGTNTEVSLKMTEGFILPASALLTALLAVRTPLRSGVIAVAALGISLLTWAALGHTLGDTYRHNGASLHQLTVPVEVTPGTRPLLVHPARKAFISWLQNTAAAHGWHKGTPLICTTFYATYALHALDAQIVAASWQVEQRYTAMDAYPRIFGEVPPSVLRKAWILKPAADGPRHMPTRALLTLGLPFPQGYTCVGVTPPDAAQGVWPPEAYELWKPKGTR